MSFYPPNVLKMTVQDFIDVLELEFYIPKLEHQVSLANFLVDLASGKAQKRLIIFHGKGNNGKSVLTNKIEKLFGNSKSWYKHHPVTKDYYSLIHSINSLSSNYIKQYESPLLISEYHLRDENQDKCLEKLLQSEQIQYKQSSSYFLKLDCVYTTCNILLHCNLLPINKVLLNQALIIEFPHDIPQRIKEISTVTLNEFLISPINNIVTEYSTLKYPE